MKLRKRILLTLLCFVMVFTMMPLYTGVAYAGADEVQKVHDVFGKYYKFNVENGLTDQDCELIYDYMFNHVDDKNNYFYGVSDKTGVYSVAMGMKQSQVEALLAVAFEWEYITSNLTTEQLQNEYENNPDNQWAKNFKAANERAQVSKDALVKEQDDIAAQKLEEEKTEVEKYNNTEPPWEGLDVSNTYAVVIQNGVTTPDKKDIRMFVISYTDTDSVKRKEYITPVDCYKESILLATQAAQKANEGSGADQYAASSSLSLTQIAAEEVNATKDVGDAFGIKVIGSSTDTKDMECFEPYNSETYTFKTKRPVSSFQGVSFITTKDHGRIEWDIQSMQLIKVNKVYGWESVGYFSDQPFISLSATRYMWGEDIEEESGNGHRPCNISGKQTMYSTFHTSTKDNDNGMRPIQSDEKLYTMNTYAGIKTYLMNITLKNLPNAGIEAYNTDYSTGKLSLNESLYAQINYMDIYGNYRDVFYPVCANSLAYYMHEIYKEKSLAIQTGHKYQNYGIDNAISFAQQGENIPFKIDIPDCLAVNNVTIMMNDTSNPNTDYFKKICDSSSRAQKFMSKTSESIQIAGIQWWDYKQAYNAKLVTNSQNPNINPVIEGDPTYYYKDTSADGLLIGNGGGFSFTLPTGSTKARSASGDYIKSQTSKNKNVNDLSTSIVAYPGQQTSSGSGNMQGKEPLVIPETGLGTGDWYAMVIHTDTPALASTTSRAFIKLTYETPEQITKSVKNEETGEYEPTVVQEEKTTSAFDLQKEANGFYGYWAAAQVPKLSSTKVAADYEEIDGSYRYGVAGGQEFTFLFRLDDKNMLTPGDFKSFTFSLEQTKNADDWQVAGFELYKITELAPRTVEAFPSQNFNKMFTNRKYNRTFKTVDAMGNPTYQQVYHTTCDPFLIQRNGTVTINARENGVEDIDQVIDRSEILAHMESMTLEQASGEMGFTETIKTYTVNVQVAANSEYGTIWDACGSDNYFYFQLQFENGNSSYVLANQQLTGDGFRSGQTESFVISTNMDYGSLIGVSIIPDTTFEGADPNDKLCIQGINVVRSTQSGVKKQWIIGYVGWIGVEFSDTGDDSNADVRKGLNEGEIAIFKEVTAESLVVSLEFEMSIGAQDATLGQFVGNLQADFEYETGSGGSTWLNNVQIVKKMYDYSNQGSFIDTDSQQYESDPDMHFRSGTTDRFVVDFSDFQALKSATFYASSDTPRRLEIKSVSVYVITSPGRLAINKANEYQMSYKTPTAYLTQTLNDKPISFLTTGSDNGKWVRTPAAVSFAENKVETTIDVNEGMNIIFKEPQGTNDKLNAFFDIDTMNTELNTSLYNIELEVEYKPTDKSTVNYVQKQSMEMNADRTGFYVYGMDVSRFDSIKNVTIRIDNQNCKFILKNGYITLQRTRNNVLLETSRALFGTSNLSTTGFLTASSTTSINTTPTKLAQLKVQLASNQTPAKISAENNNEFDIAACVTYKSSNDNSGRGNKVMTSYVFATEAEPGNTKDIRGGSILTFNFPIEDIDEVTDITIMPAGGLYTRIDKAYMVYGTGKDGVITNYEKYFAFPNGGDAALNGRKFTVANVADQTIDGYLSTNGVREVTVTVTTGSGDSGDMGCEAADMEITFNKPAENRGRIEGEPKYVEEGGTAATVKFLNVQKYLEDPNQTSFISGQTQTMKFFIKDYGTIRNIKFIPRGSTSLGIWKIDRIEVSASGFNQSAMFEGAKKTISPNKVVYEANGGYAFDMSNVSVTVNYEYSDKFGLPLSGTAVNSSAENIQLPPGQQVVFKPEVAGSLHGKYSCTYKVEEVTNGAVGPVDSQFFTMNEDKHTLTFTAPENNSVEAKVYRVTFTSTECESVETSIRITVPVGEKAPENTSEVVPEA